MQPDVTAVIVEILAVEMNVTAEDVRAARSLRNDLGMDSISAANVLFNLEEELDVELDLEQVESIDSIGEIQALVQGLAAAEA